MTNEIALFNNAANLKPVGTNASAGLTIIDAHQHSNGFCYQLGIRESHGLLIIEGLAEGTACMFLSGIQVRDRATNKEICTVEVERGTRYSRETVEKLVKKALCKSIGEAAIRSGRAFDMQDVEEQVEAMLDDCYFSECREAALGWAQRVGLIG